jgi:hypothetical protein
MKIEPIFQMPTAWTGVSDRFGVHLFEGRVTPADMDRMQALGDQWYKRNPGKLVELVVVFPSETVMTSEERQRMARLIKHWEKHRIASATVILAAGMLGAMHRSVLTGMLMIAPPPHPSKIFSNVGEAVTLLLPHVRSLSDATTTTGDVMALVDEWSAA